jgi:cyclophilin family peptidyl-prolyl cis-trans isomerase
VRRTLAIASICLAAALGACGDDENDGNAQQETQATTQAAPETTPTEPPTQTEAGDCKQAEPPESGERTAKKPKGKLAAGKTYRLVVATNCGEFTIELDQKAAPKTAASLVALAEAKFYDGTTFHRIVPGFVIQGGDPTGTGGGGPGYSTVDKPPADARYTRGVVAMAKTGQEAPGTAGSQFFVVVGADAGLPPDYAVVGKVTDGMDVVELIGQLGDPATEQPTQPVVMQSVKVEES